MIAITLPRKLIDKIINGQKRIELRKSVPVLEGCMMQVYVVEKGTKRVPIQFRVDSICYRTPWWIWVNYEHQLGITFNEFMNYTKSSKKLYGWHICNVRELSPTFDIDCLGIKKAPQSFVYIGKERRKRNDR